MDNPVRGEITSTFTLSLIILWCLAVDGGQCSFYRTPLNAARRIGEPVVMMCGANGCNVDQCCDHPCENLAWVRYLPNSSDTDEILIFNKVSPEFSDHISLVDPSSGSCDLEIQVQTSSDAGTYVCTDLLTGERVSAELVAIPSSPECEIEITGITCNVTCFLKFFGNWAPTMEWTRVTGHHSSTTKATEATDVSRGEVKISVTFPLIEISDERELVQYKCVVKFTEHGRPEGTTAENVPRYRSLSFGAV